MLQQFIPEMAQQSGYRAHGTGCQGTECVIEHLDMLPALKRSAGKQLYAQTTRDMHPGKNGYRVIGEAVAEYLKR